MSSQWREIESELRLNWGAEARVLELAQLFQNKVVLTAFKQEFSVIANHSHL
ncbi:hypothetical protein [Undibacterium parvum]|uniref:hypothetical protein n=1 Tax=Undibacterium parvum TaxID=401471 RepID=UPI001476FA86|nr:hypothetical protein [Undibacterium parvum]